MACNAFVDCGIRIDGSACRHASEILAHIAELLEELGPHNVGMPHIRHLEDKLWEMRMTGRDSIARAIYVARSGKRLAVLHVFTKKTQKTPPKNIAIAHERLRSLTDE